MNALPTGGHLHHKDEGYEPDGILNQCSRPRPAQAGGGKRDPMNALPTGGHLHHKDEGYEPDGIWKSTARARARARACLFYMLGVPPPHPHTTSTQRLTHSGASGETRLYDQGTRQDGEAHVFYMEN